MKNLLKEFLISFCIAVFMIVAFYFTFSVANNDSFETEAPKTIKKTLPSIKETSQIIKNSNETKVILSVPYISEAPENIWVSPWKNACEEASIAMVENFYKKKNKVSVSSAKEFMQMLFDVQDKIYGSNANSDAHRTNELINNYTSFKGKIIDNPSLEEIKTELKGGRPIISFHRGFDLKNINIPFLATGSSFHVLVIIGYDDIKGEFITHDDGDSVSGVEHRYEYNLFMNSLHDYNFKRQLADDVPRVIFTSSGE